MSEIRFIVSDESINSHGLIVKTSGIDTTSFMNNPVLLFNHNYDDVIGKWSNIEKVDNKLFASPIFDELDNEAMKIKSKVEQGYIKGSSIGIKVKDYEENEDGVIEITNSELFEISITPLPSNNNAVKLFLDEEETDIETLSLNLKNKNKTMSKEIDNYLGLENETPKEDVVELQVEGEDLTDEQVETTELKSDKETLIKNFLSFITDNENSTIILSMLKSFVDSLKEEDIEVAKTFTVDDVLELSKLIEGVEIEENSFFDRVSKVLSYELSEDKTRNENEMLLKIKELGDVIKQIEDDKVEAEKNETISLIDSAIESGKVKKDQRDNLITLSEANRETFVEFIKNLPEAVKLNHIIEESKEEDEKLKWTFTDWAKNDLKGLNDMKVNNPSKYWSLFNEKK